MSEVKAQGAPGRIFVSKSARGIFPPDRDRIPSSAVEYIRADIARELAEALHMAVDDDEIASFENSGSISRISRSKIHAALAKWREATEEQDD